MSAPEPPGAVADLKNAEDAESGKSQEPSDQRQDSLDTSDLNSASSEPEAKKPYPQILKEEVAAGMSEMRRPALGLFFSGLSAGLDVGFSLLLMAVMRTLTKDSPRPLAEILVANMYAVGFIFVVLGRSELFTEHTSLAVLPVLRGKSTIGALLRLWSLVYVANVIGAALFAALVAWTAPMLGVIDPKAFGEIAHRLTDHTWLAIFIGGMFAGWLMGLLSWLVTAARDTISQIVIVWMITSAIGFAHLQHPIVGAVEVLASYFAHQSTTLGDFAKFLTWSTLGAAVGGTVFVAIVKFSHASRSGEAGQGRVDYTA